MGVGGMGIVYRATYVENGKEVALKILSPGMTDSPQIAKRFEREMAILKKLKHPHIVRYFGGGKSGGQLFYAMELMPGGTVEDALKQASRFTWERTLEVLRQVAEALEYSHNASIVHRDLKPANLFFDKQGKVRLGDFGIARDTDATALTAAGKTVGTYAYMAPEQIAGKPPVSGKTDLYALGCVGFQLLTGETPFRADSAPEMLFKHMNDDPPRVGELAPDCPPAVEAVIDRLLEKAPEDRYFDALATQVAIDEVKDEVTRSMTEAAVATPHARTRVGGGSATKEDREVKEALAAAAEKRKKRRKKRRAAETPWYEKPAVLGGVLAAVVLGVGYVIFGALNPSEEELYAAAVAGMAGDDLVVWDDTRRGAIEPLLARYPDSPHADEARAWLDQIAMAKRVKQVKTFAALGKPPKSDAEQLYREANKFEAFGDRLTAVSRYRDMAQILEKSLDDPGSAEENRIFMQIARQRVAEIEAEGGLLGRDELLRNALADAYASFRTGDVLDARKTFNAVIDTYGGVAECAPYVTLSRKFVELTNVDQIDFELPEWL